jgi:hypothetical protein
VLLRTSVISSEFFAIHIKLMPNDTDKRHIQKMTSDEYNQACIERLHKLHFQERVAIIGSGLSNHLHEELKALSNSMSKRCKVEKLDGEPDCQFFDRAFKSG